MSSTAKPLMLMFAAYYLVRVLNYYATGVGGPTLLAINLLPVAYILATLDSIRNAEFYPRLPAGVAFFLALTFIGLSLFASTYLTWQFEEIRFARLGRWNFLDRFAGLSMIILVLEYARRKFFPIFVLNAVLILYAAYGRIVPGMFRHPGVSWRRIITSMALETTTGVYSDLTQLGLTLIGAFFLVLAVLRGFGCIESILKWAQKLATRSRHALPQSAVIGSFAVATVSGSGPANAATTGAATIPALKEAGFPAENAAAVETAASLGGQLMPPVMGVTAFLMVEFLGVGYFDVVARGLGPALVYFFGVSAAVYLLTAKYQANAGRVTIPTTDFYDNINMLAFVGTVGSLIFVLGYLRMSAMLSALRISIGLLVFLSVFFFYRTLLGADRIKSSTVREKVEHLSRPFVRTLDTFATIVCDVVILLALLGILTGIFTITGIPTKVGALLVEAAAFHVIAVILIAVLFGYVMGMGLPPAPVYIIVVLAVAPTMRQLGIETWVIHFFAFFMGVFGHLSPPTSLTAAVAAKIADADYTKTILRSLESCIPLIILIFAVFSRPELVVETGMGQLQGFLLVLAGTLGVVFSLHCHYHKKQLPDLAIRAIVLALALVALFHPSRSLAYGVSLPILMFVVYGIALVWRGDMEYIAAMHTKS
jgi:TRAP transporter 4TM/12TM fusion protein